MRAGDKLPAVIRWVLLRALPRQRRDDVLVDLEDSLRQRTMRAGRRAARRRLWREVLALFVWRLGSLLPRRQRPRGSEQIAPARGGTGNRHEGVTTHTPIRPAEGERRSALLSDLALDVRFGVRTLARKPSFALAALAILGLGIGAPVTVFTLVDRIFFERPPEVAEPQRLVTIYRSWANSRVGGSLGNPDYVYYRDNVSTLSGLAAAGSFANAAYSINDTDADQLRLRFVSDNYFDVLGVKPADGRFFAPQENATPGTHPVAVLSYGFWRRAFGTDADAVGRTLRLNGQPFTVVGIAPEAFRGLSPLEGDVDAWVPIAMYGSLARESHTAWWERLPNNRSNWLTLVGRLAPGVTFEAAETNLTALWQDLDYDGKDPDERILVTRQYLYSPTLADTLTTLSRMLLAVVGIVLAIAAANVAVLLLSRATTRGRELGIRTALGAGSGRIIRQLLAESMLLGLGGGALGVLLAYLFADAAAKLLPFRFPGAFVPAPGVLAVAAALSVVTAVSVGLAPALFSTRSNLVRVIGDPRSGGSRSRLRDALVVGQVALSLILVAAAVLFGRSFWAASSQEVGWRTDRRLVVQVDLRSRGLDEQQGRAFVRRGVERIAGIPGVEGVTTTRMIPFQGDWTTDFEAPPELFPGAPPGPLLIGVNAVGPDYFDIMGVEITQGRALTREDNETALPAVVVNETLARTLWPDQRPLGKTVPRGFFPGRGDQDFTIVGVARDVTYYELGEAPVAQVYASALQVYVPEVNFLVATAGAPTALAAAVQDTLRDVDPNLAFSQVTTMASVFEDQVARYRVSAVLVGLFGAIALVLAATGLYGVVSFLVARRTREIGVRMALGAQRGRVAGEVLAMGLRLATVGVVLGLAGALALRRFTAGLLYGVAPYDPWPLVGACATLAAVTLVAALAPARRATLVDPARAIRGE